MNVVGTSDIETEFERLERQSFERVSHILRSFSGEACVEMLKQTFAAGEPTNRHIRDAKGQWVDYVRQAYDLGKVDALAYLIDVNYEALQATGRIFKNYHQYPEVLSILVKHGHSFTRMLENDSANFWINVSGQGRSFFVAIAKQGVSFDGLQLLESIRVPAITRFAMYPKENDLVGHLLAAGANPEIRGTGGISVLHGAVTQGKLVRTRELDSDENARYFERTLRAVLAAGASIDMVDDEGKSALHTACKLGYFNKAKILLEAGADHHLKDKNGSTPQDLARAAKRRDVLQLFAATRARAVILDVIGKAAAVRNKA